jgi:4-aminobutyrate aminotransferase and related aminotransferases
MFLLGFHLQVGNFLLTHLSKLREEFAIVGDVRGKGLMIGVDLVQDKETKVPLNSRHMTHILDSCKEHGLLLGRGGLSGNVSIVVAHVLTSRKRREKEDRIGERQPFRERKSSPPLQGIEPATYRYPPS